jgi:membrane-associated protease RseP (regulator of RpoE activity)
MEQPTRNTRRATDDYNKNFSQLIIGGFTFSVVEGVFKIVHVSGAEWKFAPSSD